MKPFKFILGGIVGAATALLFAPRSGKETRELVAGKVEEYMESDSPVAEKMRGAAEKVKPVAESAKEKAKDIVESAKEPAANAVDKINEIRDKLTDQILKNQQAPREVEVDVVPVEQTGEVSSQIDSMVGDLIENAQASEKTAEPVVAAAEEIANNIDDNK